MLPTGTLTFAATETSKDITVREYEAAQQRVQELEKDLDDAKAQIASLRDKAARTEHRTSVVSEMNGFLVKAVALTGGTTTLNEFGTEATQQSANIAIAFAGTGLPAFALFMAGLYRRKRLDEPFSPIPQTHVLTKNAKLDNSVAEALRALTQTLKSA